MRFHFGKLSWEQDEPLIEEGWQRIRSPSSRLGYGLAIFIGWIVISMLILWLIAVSLFATGREIGTAGGGGGESAPWGVVIAALFLSIPIHELIHAIWLPNLGLSPQTVMVIWPKKLWIGVYYNGCLTRGRWLLMRMAPFVCLTFITIGLLTLFEFIPASFAFAVFLQVLFLVNGIGSGGDIVAVIWVLFQVPTKSQICFHRGKAYWRLVA